MADIFFFLLKAILVLVAVVLYPVIISRVFRLWKTDKLSFLFIMTLFVLSFVVAYFMSDAYNSADLNMTEVPFPVR